MEGAPVIQLNAAGAARLGLEARGKRLRAAGQGFGPVRPRSCLVGCIVSSSSPGPSPGAGLGCCQRRFPSGSSQPLGIPAHGLRGKPVFSGRKPAGDPSLDKLPSVQF